MKLSEMAARQIQPLLSTGIEARAVSNIGLVAGSRTEAEATGIVKANSALPGTQMSLHSSHLALPFRTTSPFAPASTLAVNGITTWSL